MFYWIMKTMLAPILNLLFRPQVEGLDNVPATGGAILASNHVSFSDSVFKILVVPRRITFLAKNDYFTGHGLAGRLKVAFFRGLGQVPLDRSGGKASEAALWTGLRILREGHLLGIYPEGTRSPDGRLYRGKTGVARMALEAGVPVIPVAMINTFYIQPTGRIIPRIARAGVHFGTPLDFSRYDGMQGDPFVLRSITDEIVYQLMVMSGQEYVDQYAAKAKADLAAARAGDVAAVGGEPVPGEHVTDEFGEEELGVEEFAFDPRAVEDGRAEGFSIPAASLGPDAATTSAPDPEHRRAS